MRYSKEDLFWDEIKDDWVGRQYIARANKFFSSLDQKIEVAVGQYRQIVDSDQYLLEIIEKESKEWYECRSFVITEDYGKVIFNESMSVKLSVIKILVENSLLKRVE